MEQKKKNLTTIPDKDIVICDEDLVAQVSGELKPCPFCGGKAYSSGLINRSSGITVYSVSCRKCMGQTFYSAYDADKARSGAVDRWNKRVQSCEGGVNEN